MNFSKNTNRKGLYKKYYNTLVLIQNNKQPNQSMRLQKKKKKNEINNLLTYTACSLNTPNTVDNIS